MRFSPQAFEKFYESSMGKMAQRFVQDRMQKIWPDVRNYSLLGIGYPQPYLNDYCKQAERTLVMMPPLDGRPPVWQEQEKNQLYIGLFDEQPFTAESFDRLLVIHSLEYLGHVPHTLSECWRLLKPNGRMLLVVPNRMSIWMRAEETPFGFGTPYTYGQIRHYLQEAHFHIERQHKALFVPPFETRFMQTLSPFIEGFGQNIFKGLGGVHIIEVSKQLFAPIKPDRGSRLEAATRLLVPKPAVPSS